MRVGSYGRPWLMLAIATEQQIFSEAAGRSGQKGDIDLGMVSV